MRLKNLLLTLIICHSVSFAQKYSGEIVDGLSGEPVPYVNIGIVSKNIGTVSNSKGEFTIELDSSQDNDSLFISCIGYKRKAFLISSLKESFNPSGKIIVELETRIYEINEVVVRPFGTKIYTLGNFCDVNSAYGNAFYSKELGTEIGVIIKLPRNKKTAFLQNLRFVVGKFTFGRFPVRINIYNLKDGKPGENILKEQILTEIKSAGEHIIDLDKYKIITDGDFFISLEYYRVPDRKFGELIFCAKEIDNKGNGYYRLTSQGNWTPEIVANVGFSVQIKCEE